MTIDRQRVFVLVVAILVGCVRAASGQAAPPGEVDALRLADRIAELEAAESAGDVEPAAIQELDLLRQTRAFLDQGVESLATADRFAGEARSAPEQAQRIDDFLAEAIDDQVAAIDVAATLEHLNGELESVRVRLQAERELRAKVDADETHRAQRRDDIPSLRGAATERLDAIAAELAAGTSPDDLPQVAVAKRWRALAERFAQQAAVHAIDEEIRNYDIRKPLLEKRRAFRDRHIAIETRNVTALQEAIGVRQVALAEAAEAEAARQRRQAATAHPFVQDILDDSKAITRRNTEILGLVGDDAGAKAAADEEFAAWTTSFERSKTRVDRVGLTNAIGQHLRRQRALLPDTRAMKRRMSDRDRLIGDLVNEAADVALRVDQLIDVDAAVDDALAAYDGALPADDEEIEEIRLAARDALLQQREYVTTLSASINGYLDDTLLDVQSTQRDTRDLIEAYGAYIDERILWIRSAEPVQPADVGRAGDALAAFVDGRGWRRLGETMWSDVRRHLPGWLGALVVIGGLVAGQPFLRRRLETIRDRTKRLTTDRLMLTVEALGITMVLAGLVPVVMMVLAWRLGHGAVDGSLGAALAAGLFRAGELLFAAELIRRLCRPEGVGETHFRWKRPTLRVVVRQLRWLTPIAVPMAFLVGATSADDAHHDSLGRFAFVIMMVAFAAFVHRIASPTTGVMRGFLTQHRGGWLDRLKYVWHPLIVASPLATAIVAVIGYFYSAEQLEQRVLSTIWLLLLVLVGRAVLLRGLLLAQRRIDIEQRKKKLAAQVEAENDPNAAPQAPELVPVDASGDVVAQSLPEAKEIDVAAMSAQTRQLLNAAVAFAVMIGLVVVWIDMLPALGFFQEVTVWTPDVAETVAVADAAAGGGEAEAAEAAVEPVTLGNVVYAILILILTALVSKNIPGLLEIVLLQRLPISPSGRYAVTTLARYALVIIGLAIAFAAIGIGWSKVQWLAAAITVGLGFGLQEIFANFVSGLIILFERPIRVGDTVTVGGITGTVSRLRIRATTIVDWDRKELIIPNREFVTGQIVNWTLSDPILRLVVPVGIAYGSDTKLAEELLLRVAADDPIVLDEPAPSVVFTEFADSALTFRLRVFIPHIENLFGVQHRLHNAIDQAFREAGIVIAFPQRDVYLHQVKPDEPDA